MISILASFIFGGLIPYMARRFAKFMPATPAYAIYRLIKPNATASHLKPGYKRLFKIYMLRSLLYAVALSALTAFLTYIATPHIGWWCVFIWILALLAEIDIRCFLLPDILTVPLLVCGFTFASFNPFVDPLESATAAMAGFAIPVLATLLMLWRSIDAFGGGDIKLLTAIGSWLGMEGLLHTLLLSCLLFGIYSLLKKQRAGAFGPALSLAAIIIAVSILL